LYSKHASSRKCRKCSFHQRLRPHGRALRLAGCFLLVSTSTILAGTIAEGELIWVANGVLLAYFLLAPRRLWPAYLCVGILGHASGTALVHAPWQINLLDTPLDVGEALLGAVLLRRRSAQLPRFADRAYLLRFLGFAVIASPLLTGALNAALQSIWLHAHFASILFKWIATDSLGICVVTPACVAVFRTRPQNSLCSLFGWTCSASVVAITFALLCQAKLPLSFLLYPLLVVILLRFGLGWAAMTTLFAAAVGSWFTVHGQGPFASSNALSKLEPAVILQLFVASAMFMLYSISVVLESLRATERRLQEVAALHKLVTENSRDVIIIADFEGNRTYVSCSASNWGGFTRDDMMRLKSKDLIHPEDRPKIADAVKRLRAGADGALIECRIQGHDGGYIWTEASLRTIRDPVTGIPLGILNNARDISERKLAQEARHRQRSLIEAIHDVSLDGILVVDENQNVISCNQRFGEVWKLELPAGLPGYLEKNDRTPDEFLTRSLQSLKDPEGFLNRVEHLYANPDEKDHCEIQLKDGRTLERYSTCLRSKEGQYLGRVWFFRDITEHKLAEERLAEAYRAVEEMAITDALTGLPNRRHFDQSLAKEWRRGLRDRKPLSLLLIDADHFKTYNDTYGHLRGDNCLKQIAETAQGVVARPGDLAARFGGEEFAVILPNTSSSGALEMAQEVCRAMRERRLSHSLNPLGVVTVSVGCATLVPQLGQQAVGLVDCADKALYQAKRSGRNRVCSYEEAEAEADSARTTESSKLLAVKSA
jgi:diguanylate cyclase (GGDEF)-like protein/PAS domain S-box-containing protein